MATRKLTHKQAGALRVVLNHHAWPNECRFEESDTYTTRGGKLGCRKWDRRTCEGLFDNGLLEAVRVAGYTLSGDYPAAGILRVTEKGKQALESGKYEPAVVRVKAEKPADFVPNRSPYADLPRIVCVEDISDAGEFGATVCPHCGALGRYTTHFVCADGSHRAAMAGCFKLWPKHYFCELHQRILEKERRYAENGKQTGRAWNLPSWDVDVKEAIEAFARGNMTERDAMQKIQDAQSRAKAHRKRRFGARR